MTTRRLKALFLALFLSFFTPYSLIAAPVDINSASSGEISDALTGIGPAKAAAIVTFRNQHGPFTSVEGLLAVKGIGPATVEKNRSDILIPEKNVKSTQ